MAAENLFEAAREVNERWLPVVGYEGLYEVSDQGRVRWDERAPIQYKNSGKPFLGTFLNRQGYLCVCLTKDRKRIPRLVHRLVTAAFLGPCPNGKEVNHKDGRQKNNAALSNLEYVTHKENIAHRDSTGLSVYVKGVDHGRAILNEMKVRVIRRCARLSMTDVDLGRLFNVEKTVISHVCTGKNWGHIQGGGGTFRRIGGQRKKALR